MRDGSLENTTCSRGTDQAKLIAWREKISIVLPIQLASGFSRSLGSATSIEAYKSAMLSAEQTITASQAALCLAQMKYRYFISERCKQNVIFYEKRSYLNNISTNWWNVVS